MSTEEIVGNILKYGVAMVGIGISVTLWRRRNRVWAGVVVFAAVIAFSLGRIIAGEV